MPNFLQDRKVPIFFGRFELFCLFVACSWHESESYSVMLFLLRYGPACLKFSEITNRQYLWKGFSDFVDFLHAVVCILLGIHWSYKKMLLWVDTVRYRIPANQIVRCFKLKNSKCMRYQVGFLLPLKLRKICYFELWPQQFIGQSVCRIFYFWLVWLVNLSTRGPLLEPNTCFPVKSVKILRKFLKDIANSWFWT